jgi:hypothetical protein
MSLILWLPNKVRLLYWSLGLTGYFFGFIFFFLSPLDFLDYLSFFFSELFLVLWVIDDYTGLLG